MNVQETIGGSGLLLVKDSLTGLALDCDVRFAVRIDLRVTNEEDYRFFTSAEPINLTLKSLIDACFPSCCRSAYPGGVEWKDLAAAPLPIAAELRETILPMLASRGVEPESVQFLQFVPDDRAAAMIENARRNKPKTPEEALREELERINSDPGCNIGAMQKAGLFGMTMQNAADPAPKPDPAPAASPRKEWLCACGSRNTSRFCPSCGASEPTEWLCACGSRNSSRFCPNCGAEKGK